MKAKMATARPLVLLQGFVANQGDAWSYTLDYLKRFLDDCRQGMETVSAAGASAHASYLLFAAPWADAPGNYIGRWRKQPVTQLSIPNRSRRPTARNGRTKSVGR